MSTDQWVALIRQLLPALGGLLIALGLAETRVSAAITNLTLMAGPAVLIISGIWSIYANSKQSILQSASQMPEVDQIQMKPSEAARDLADNLPDNVQVRGHRESGATGNTPYPPTKEE